MSKLRLGHEGLLRQSGRWRDDGGKARHFSLLTTVTCERLLLHKHTRIRSRFASGVGLVRHVFAHPRETGAVKIYDQPEE